MFKDACRGQIATKSLPNINITSVNSITETTYIISKWTTTLEMFISFHLALCNVNDKRWRSALLQFCLACRTKFTHTSTCTHKHSHLLRQEQFSRNPGATTARLLCETFIIYDVFDMVICINFRGILIRLKQLK